MRKFFILCVSIFSIALIISGYFYYLARSREGAPTREIIVSESIAPSISSENSIPQTDTISKKWIFTRVDSSHYASGMVSIEKSGDGYDIVLSPDFFTPSAPDLYVWLSRQSDFSRWLDRQSRYLDLGPLRRNTGSSTFHISEQELDAYGWSLVIWCKAFSIYFSHAILN